MDSWSLRRRKERAEGGEEQLVTGQGKWRRRARLCTNVCLSESCI